MKPQILAAISGAIQAYLADEEAVLMQQQAMALSPSAIGVPSGPPVKSLGPGRPPGGHANAPLDTAP